ncbi:HD domain-containing phosphohydrolase [Deinococcus multiflagellatus]|uniref:HD domain-containing phosphohydrolase n=1 Tax=Deinococcus multiflagellatus TaxID=1656887 RepID=UPI001CCF0AAC|nr:HD domain-containing phosphohydrolase [Deinococcus multiflagellatus]MBZ9711872.1 HD domain-containing protein [Deinococcus multiflagellatus]
MFRRPRTPQPPGSAEARASVPSESPDVTRVIADLLARPTQEGILEGALAYAATLMGGSVQGFAIVRRGQDRVAAVLGYPKTLLGVALGGPWASMRPRVLTDGARELYEGSPPEAAPLLDEAGMKAVTLSLVVPLTVRGRNLGALVLDRTSEGGLPPAAQEAVTKWAAAVAPLMGVLEGREEWRAASRQLTGALVEAVESGEFDALGHAQSVTDLSLKLGRLVGLTEREQEELWYAAMLHDIGKIHGEQGHAQVGANFLHGVPHLAEAMKAVRHHHERWDGQGEPDRLAGEDIPLYARILAVANSAVRMGGPDRVKGQAGKALDPRLVGLLEKLPQ